MMRRTPMKRGTKPLKAKKPWRPRYKSQSKRPNREFAAACHGERCFLLVPGGCDGAVVPCHSNQQVHGKGMGHKADDYYTVPGCRRCHHEIDQGKNLSKEGRRHIWDRAFERWLPVRARKMEGSDASGQGRLEQEAQSDGGVVDAGDDLSQQAQIRNPRPG